MSVTRVLVPEDTTCHMQGNSLFAFARLAIAWVMGKVCVFRLVLVKSTALVTGQSQIELLLQPCVMILRLESATLHTSVDADLQALETRLSVLPSTKSMGLAIWNPRNHIYSRSMSVTGFYGQEILGKWSYRIPDLHQRQPG